MASPRPFYTARRANRRMSASLACSTIRDTFRRDFAPIMGSRCSATSKHSSALVMDGIYRLAERLSRQNGQDDDVEEKIRRNVADLLAYGMMVADALRSSRVETPPPAPMPYFR